MPHAPAQALTGRESEPRRTPPSSPRCTRQRGQLAGARPSPSPRSLGSMGGTSSTPSPNSVTSARTSTTRGSTPAAGRRRTSAGWWAETKLARLVMAAVIAAPVVGTHRSPGYGRGGSGRAWLVLQTAAGGFSPCCSPAAVGVPGLAQLSPTLTLHFRASLVACHAAVSRRRGLAPAARAPVCGASHRLLARRCMPAIASRPCAPPSIAS
jgi:hypothetical protein